MATQATDVTALGLTQEGVLLASAARTADTQSADQVNYNMRGLVLFLAVTTFTTGTLAIRILGKDPVSGNYLILNGNVSVSAVGKYAIVLYHGATATGLNVSQVTSQPLPRTWAAKIETSDGSAATYSLGYSLVA